MSEEQFQGPLNMEPPTCLLCGGKHEPEYPHLDTFKFRQLILQKHGRAATQFDLMADMSPAFQNTMMIATLQNMALR